MAQSGSLSYASASTTETLLTPGGAAPTQGKLSTLVDLIIRASATPELLLVDFVAGTVKRAMDAGAKQELSNYSDMYAALEVFRPVDPDKRTLEWAAINRTVAITPSHQTAPAAGFDFGTVVDPRLVARRVTSLIDALEDYYTANAAALSGLNGVTAIVAQGTLMDGVNWMEHTAGIFGGSNHPGVAGDIIVAPEASSMYPGGTWETIDRIAGAPPPPATGDLYE